MVGAKRKRVKREYDFDDYKKKRSRSKYAATRALKPSIGRGPLIRQQKVVMRYVSYVNLGSGLPGITAIHIYSANGMFDPDISGVGQQPRGFDQLMALYDHFVVLNCKITMDFSQSANVATQYGFAIRDSTTTDSSRGYIEGGNVVYATRDVQGGQPTRLVMNCNPNAFLGRSAPMADPDLKGSTSANPAEQAFIHIWQINQNSGEVAPVSGICTLMEYTAMLIEPVVPGSS